MKKTIPFLIATAVLLAPTSSRADDINSIFRIEPDMTLEEARKLATDGAVSYNTDEKDKVVNFTGQVTVGFEADLAAVSDDGSTVIVNGGAASSRFGNAQDLYNANESFQSAGVLSAGTHSITLNYKNTIQADANDYNGVVLVAFGGSRPISGVTLKTVTFSDAGVTKDDGGSYSGAHYDASRTGDIAHPVAWKTGSKPTASATFTITPVNTKKKVKIRGTGGGLWFPTQELTPSAGKVTYTSTASTNALPATVSAGNISIAWQYSTDNGATYKPIGSSSNKAYVSVSGGSGVETLLDISCRGAAGKTATAKDDIVAGIWGVFNNPKRVSDNQSLKYWHNNAADATNSTALIKDANGQCGSWAEFFRDALNLQNVSATKLTVLPTYGGGLMLVKNWTFGLGSAPFIVRPFTHRPDEYSDGTGTAGQSNPNPPGAFFNHFIVQYGSKYYDPSYYSGPFNSHAAWEDASLDGFAQLLTISDNFGNVVERGYFAKTNTTGDTNVETSF